MNASLKTLWELFSIFFKIGLCTFGGGIAMLPILERELVEKRNWVESNELLDYFAIGQSTPGIIAVNVATFVGYKRAKIIGGCIATFGMVCPSLIIITVIALFISNFADIVWVQKALVGINVAVAAILTSAVFSFSKKSVKNVFGFFLLLVSFVLIFVFNVGTIWIILGSALLGVLLAGIRGDLSAKEKRAAEKSVEDGKGDEK
ncbi:MAG: chromate transporter [Treponema sp.]|nr:chromate transporter [Treponema sp.]